MPTAAIALGSNLSSHAGPPAANLDEALRRMDALGHVTAVSAYHLTSPLGNVAQPDFLNAAALLKTALPPPDLMQALLSIEAAMGRDRASVPLKGPRIIDLDLLLYDELVVLTPQLTVPHPAMAERRFVLAPLAEIAPGWIHPQLHRSIASLLAGLSG